MIIPILIRCERERYEILLIMLLVLSSIFLIQCSNPEEKLKPEGIWLLDGQEYETDIGVLKGGFLLQNGNQMRNGKMAFGAAYMDSEHAISINKNMNVMQTNQKLDVEVTLLQDKKNGKWLATKGWIGIKDGEYFLLDNTRVKVIGGDKNPILINGKSFTNTELIAKK